jgi:hypothetical protein
MRSSKKRSRSNQNRPRTLGNIINRVFDSSGPEGKVRGTPQQIIEKYQMLARDAQLSNDRVAAENFLQHAEHYTRLLAEAQREQAAEQEARQAQFQQNGGNREYRDRDRDRDQRDRDRPDYRDPGSEDQPSVEVLDFGSDEAGLVETPEATRRDDRPREDRPREDRPREDRPRGDRPQNDRRDRRDFRRDRDERRRDAPAPDAAEPAPALPDFITSPAPAAAAPVTSEPETPEPAAKPRRPRKPKAEAAE